MIIHKKYSLALVKYNLRKSKNSIRVYVRTHQIGVAGYKNITHEHV